MIAAFTGGDLVKPVERPVEALELGPLEARVCGSVIFAVGEEEVAGGTESFRRRRKHGAQNSSAQGTVFCGRSVSGRLRQSGYFRFLLEPFEDDGGPHSVH